MNKMKRLTSSIAMVSAVLLTAGTVQATVSFKDLDGANSFWTNAANWDDALPAVGEWAQIHNSGTLDSDSGVVQKVTVGYNDGTALTVTASGFLSMDEDLVPGRNGSGEVILNGGTINIGRDFDIGYSSNKTGTVTMNSGTVNIVRDLGIVNPSSANSNAGGHSALFDMLGGTIYVGDDLDMNTLLVGGATGVLNLYGGSIILNDDFESNSQLQMATNCATLNFGGGTLVLPGDQISKVNGYFGNGYITSDLGGVSVTYDDVNTTIIGVIPEPATLGLVAVFGGAILFMRRRRN
jgi:hypothetical protein